MPIGTLTRKIQRQLTLVTIRPPSTGPSAGAASVGIMIDRRRPGPLGRREGPEQHGEADRRQHPAADALQDPERRSAGPIDCAAPHSSEPTVNAMSANRNDPLRAEPVAQPARRRDPHREAERVAEHDPLGVLGVQLSPSAGMATLTIVVSRMSRNSADT